MLLFIGWMSMAPAQTVLLPAPGAPVREYHARLKASPEYVSPIEAYRRHHPTPAHRDLLLARFADAQIAFTERPVDEAVRSLRDLVALLPEDDWGDREREIFLTGFLRLAQLDPAQGDQWLGRALTLGPGLQVEAGLFPPPLLARWEKLRAAAPRVKPKLGNFGEVLVNGVSCTRERCPEMPKVAHPTRVTYLADKFAPVVTHAPLAEIEPARLETHAFVAGACGAPEFTAAARAFEDKTAFFGLDCGKEISLAPVTAPASSWPLPRPEEPRGRRAFYHSPWFWAGAVAILTTAIVLSQPHGGGGEGGPAEPAVVVEPTVTHAN